MLENDSNITIDEEFRDLLPTLPDDVFTELERSIVVDGCRDAIVLWDGVIVDGHNRYAICRKHDLPFNVSVKEFCSREEAMIWIISTQFGRRQLSREEMTYYRGMQYNLEKIVEPHNQYTAKSAGVQNGHQQKTADRLAEQYDVAATTIRRDARTAEVIDKIGHASPSAKQAILSGKANITKKELESLHKATDDEVAAVAGQIADGTYKNESQADPVLPEDDAINESPFEPANKPEIVPAKKFQRPDNWPLPEPIRKRKQEWWEFINAGILVLHSIVGNIEKDIREKLPLVEKQEDRDTLRNNFQSFIDWQLEIIKLI